ncbi:MAG: ABC transporter permease [Bacteroidota bacterium]
MRLSYIIGEQVFSIIARNFIYNRFYTFINIGGLAAGLTCAIFIILFIKDEITYDQHHLKKDRIYRLESDFSVSGRYQKVARTSYPFGPVFKEMFPEIEDFVRFREIEALAARVGRREFFERNLLYADSSVFNIFTHKFIYGIPHKALREPGSIVLTRSMSERYFGKIDPCGRYLELGNGTKCRVTAVIEDVPGNSHIKFDGLISMSTYARLIGESVFHDLETRQAWAIRIFTFILLKENTSIESIHKKFPIYYEKHMAEFSQILNGTYKLMSSPLTSIHLYSGLEQDMAGGDISIIYLFAVIGIFILLIAAINYMNLSTARSAAKAREVGIRKVAGASKGRLIQLFISESVILSLISFAVALTAADLLMPWFNSISGKSIELLHGITDPILYITLLITLIVGIIAGFYPAFYLSSFKPANVIYGRMFRNNKRGIPRKVLMFFQFFISISMIIGTIIVFQQLKHIRTSDLGFNKENLLVITVTDTNALRSYPAIREKFMQLPGILNVSSSLFITGLGSAMDIMLVEDTGQYSRALIGLNYITHHFIEMMEMKIVRGRDFNPKNLTDASKHVLINETAARKLNWSTFPIGKEITVTTRPDEPYKVIGVIEDFHYAPLYEEIGPMVYFLKDKAQQEVHIRIDQINKSTTLKMIEHIWKTMYPEIPFTYIFLDQELESAYLHEDKLLKLMSLFTIFSIFIALLGLFGLSSYITEQYTREIGIRKVFGASPFSIIHQLSRQYLTLIVLACTISMPVCWYLMELWLENFAYRTDILPWWFVATAAVVIIIAEATVIVQSLKAANKNPADTLRYE